mgnify:FL=1
MSSKSLFKTPRPANKIIDCDKINEICSLIDMDGNIYAKAQKIKQELIANTYDKDTLPLLKDIDNMIANGRYTSKEALANDVWLVYRRGGIGGSDASALLGLSKWNTALSLYYDKIGEKPKENITTGRQYIFDFGHAMEEFVAKHYEKVFMQEFKESVELSFSLQYGEDLRITGCRVFRDTFMYKNPEHPFMRADLDFCVALDFSNGKTATGIFECKTTSPFTIKDDWEVGPPKYYECQTRHYMAVMDYPFAIIACAADNNANNYYSHVIFRNKKAEKNLVQEEQIFWNQVQNEVPPFEMGVDNKDLLLQKSKETSPSLFRDDSPDVTNLINSYETIDNEVQILKQHLKEAEAKKNIALSDLLTYMVQSDTNTMETHIGDLIYNCCVKESVRTATNWNKIISTVTDNHPELQSEIMDLISDNQKVSKSNALKVIKSQNRNQ